MLVKTTDSTQTQELQSQSSFLSSNDPRLHFGLGSATKAELRVRWPSGEWHTMADLAVNQLVTVKEQIGIVPSIGFVLPKDK